MWILLPVLLIGLASGQDGEQSDTFATAISGNQVLTKCLSDIMVPGESTTLDVNENTELPNGDQCYTTPFFHDDCDLARNCTIDVSKYRDVNQVGAQNTECSFASQSDWLSFNYECYPISNVEVFTDLNTFLAADTPHYLRSENYFVASDTEEHTRCTITSAAGSDFLLSEFIVRGKSRVSSLNREYYEVNALTPTSDINETPLIMSGAEMQLERQESFTNTSLQHLNFTYQSGDSDDLGILLRIHASETLQICCREYNATHNDYLPCDEITTTQIAGGATESEASARKSESTGLGMTTIIIIAACGGAVVLLIVGTFLYFRHKKNGKSQLGADAVSINSNVSDISGVSDVSGVSAASGVSTA